MPPGLWLAVDSTEVSTPDGSFPAHLLLETLAFRSRAIVLTHPHGDHSRGFAELVGNHADGPIGCCTAWAGIEDDAPETADAERVLAQGEAESALAAITDRWHRQAETRWELVAGSSVALGDATVTVLHPDPEAIQRYEDRRRDPNQLSSPLLVEWRTRRLLLGADLPRAQWGYLASRGYGRELSRHDALKVSHHGSKRSLHNCYATCPDDVSRTWCIAPWTRRQGPPKFRDGGDVEALLEIEGELHFTTIAQRLRVSLRSGDRIRRREVSEATERIGFAGLGLEVLGVEPSESEAWVAVGYNEDGPPQIWHGEAAVVVID